MSDKSGGLQRATQIGLIVVAGLLGLLIGLQISSNGSVGASAESDESFAGRVRDALVGNPQILSEAFYALETHSRDAEISALQDAVDRNLSLIESAPAAVISGNLNGDITIVEFFDYECPYCRRAMPRMDELRAADGGIRYIYFEMPILGESSLMASLAALAADLQGHYEPFHHMLMASEERLSEDVIMALAAEAGLNVDQLAADMADPELMGRLRANMQLAQAVGVGSTPTFLINGQVVIGWQEDQVMALLADARSN